MAGTELEGNGSSKNCDLTLSDGHGGILTLQWYCNTRGLSAKDHEYEMSQSLSADAIHVGPSPENSWTIFSPPSGDILLILLLCTTTAHRSLIHTLHSLYQLHSFTPHYVFVLCLIHYILFAPSVTVCGPPPCHVHRDSLWQMGQVWYINWYISYSMILTLLSMLHTCWTKVSKGSLCKKSLFNQYNVIYKSIFINLWINDGIYKKKKKLWN